MVATNLQFAKLDVEPCDELFKQIVAFIHHLLCLLFGQNYAHVVFGLFKVGEQQNKDLLGIS